EKRVFLVILFTSFSGSLVSRISGAVQIWLYGRSCAFGEHWLNTIIRQTGFNPFDRDEGPSVKATQIGFGQLSRAQQVLGIGYLYVETQLRQI
ncbi:hypothetical protein EC990672_3662, partial [Escherichia coli 99.0672]